MAYCSSHWVHEPLYLGVILLNFFHLDWHILSLFMYYIVNNIVDCQKVASLTSGSYNPSGTLFNMLSLSVENCVVDVAAEILHQIVMYSLHFDHLY